VCEEDLLIDIVYTFNTSNLYQINIENSCIWFARFKMNCVLWQELYVIKVDEEYSASVQCVLLLRHAECLLYTVTPHCTVVYSDCCVSAPVHNNHTLMGMFV